MDAKTYLSVRCYLAGLVVILGALVSACTPIALPGTLVPATQNAAFSAQAESTLSGYPSPNATLIAPTDAEPWPPGESPIVTPAPSEKVAIGPITENFSPRESVPYVYRIERGTNKDGRALLLIYVGQPGSEVRLGDDNGYSDLEATSEKYISWTYRAFSAASKPTIESGLYVYSTETRESTLIIPGRNAGLSEIDGDWILYTTWDSQPPASTSARVDAPADFTMPLFAHNIVTGKVITLTKHLPVIQGRMTRSFYGISGNHASWIEYDPGVKNYAIKIYYLEKQSEQALEVDLKQPLFLSLSSDLVVWRDTYWHGYSLSQDALFTIPYAPKEWENVSGILVAAKDSAVEWRITNATDDTVLYFTAPVIAK